jgi:hypothetical protein
MRRSTAALFVIATVVVVVALLLRSGESDTITAAPTTTSAPVSSTTTSVASTSTTTSLPDGVEVCDLYGSVTQEGQIESPELVEASGLAASRTTSDVLWAHNDSRGTATLYAFRGDGENLGSYGVPGSFALDWEDMSAGPGPQGEGDFLYVGDIGDNFDIRGGVITVYRVPDVDPSELEGSFPESLALTYRYPRDGHNAEALFIDPTEPALYLITKDKSEALVFKAQIDRSDEPTELELVSTLFLGAEVSGADMSEDGSTLVVRGYQTVWMWHRESGVSITDMLHEDPCLAPSPNEHQGEAITFDASSSYWTVSEGLNSPIHQTTRLP